MRSAGLSGRATNPLCHLAADRISGMLDPSQEAKVGSLRAELEIWTRAMREARPVAIAAIADIYFRTGRTPLESAFDSRDMWLDVIGALDRQLHARREEIRRARERQTLGPAAVTTITFGCRQCDDGAVRASFAEGQSQAIDCPCSACGILYTVRTNSAED
jgi:hypothetical protein